MVELCLSYPLKHVVPAHSEAPGRVDEASRVSVEAAGDGVHHRELAEGVDDVLEAWH